MRDPRQDPQKGDRLRKGKFDRIVAERVGSQINYGRGSSRGLEYRSCWITTWQAWAKDADVIEVGK